MTQNEGWKPVDGMDKQLCKWKAILQNISATDTISQFTDCKFDDHLLPIPDESSLPFGLDDATRKKFLAEQERVLRPYSDFDVTEDFDEHELRHIGETKLREAIEIGTMVGGGGYADVCIGKLAKNKRMVAVKLFKRPPQKDNSEGIWKGYGNVGKHHSEYQYPYPTLRAFEKERLKLLEISKKISALDRMKTDKGNKEQEKKKKEKEIAETHVVHIQRSFTTEKHHGLVLLPIAACDLEHLLQAYSYSLSEGRASVRIKDKYEVKKSDVNQWLWQYFACIASIVDMLHSWKIRHDDITPKNLLCGRVDGSVIIDGIIRICDFGTSVDVNGPNGETPGRVVMQNLQWTTQGRRCNDAQTFQDEMYTVGLVFLDIYTVIRGRSIAGLQEYIGSHEPFPWQESLEGQADRDKVRPYIPIHKVWCLPSVLSDWLDDLCATTPEPDNMNLSIKTLIKSLLHIDPAERPRSSELLEILNTMSGACSHSTTESDLPLPVFEDGLKLDETNCETLRLYMTDKPDHRWQLRILADIRQQGQRGILLSPAQTFRRVIPISGMSLEANNNSVKIEWPARKKEYPLKDGKTYGSLGSARYAKHKTMEKLTMCFQSSAEADKFIQAILGFLTNTPSLDPWTGLFCLDDNNKIVSTQPLASNVLGTAPKSTLRSAILHIHQADFMKITLYVLPSNPKSLDINLGESSIQFLGLECINYMSYRKEGDSMNDDVMGLRPQTSTLEFPLLRQGAVINPKCDVRGAYREIHGPQGFFDFVSMTGNDKHILCMIGLAETVLLPKIIPLRQTKYEPALFLLWKSKSPKKIPQLYVEFKQHSSDQTSWLTGAVPHRLELSMEHKKDADGHTCGFALVSPKDNAELPIRGRIIKGEDNVEVTLKLRRACMFLYDFIAEHE